jgi:hypothetical protein
VNFQFICSDIPAEPAYGVWMKKGPGIAYDKWNISVVICDTDIPSGQPSHGDDRKSFEVMTST